MNPVRFADRSQNLGVAYFCDAELRIFVASYFLILIFLQLPLVTLKRRSNVDYSIYGYILPLGSFFLHPVRVGQWTQQKITTGRNYEVFQKASELRGKLIEARKKL